MSTYNYMTESTYQKINRFFVEQIPQLETPIIDSKPNCVTVGPYRIITNRNNFEVWIGRKKIEEFNKRSWAVGYAICLYRGEKVSAFNLLNINKQYSKLDEERLIYNHFIEVNTRNKNRNQSLIFENRLSRVDSEIFSIEHRAETILKSLHLG